jgi:hypothetical protein
MKMNKIENIKHRLSKQNEYFMLEPGEEHNITGDYELHHLNSEFILARGIDEINNFLGIKGENEVSVKESTNPDYPGVFVSIGEKELVLVEYDVEEDKHNILVWDDNNPDGDPVYKQVVVKKEEEKKSATEILLERFPEHVIETLRQRNSLDPSDTSMDEDFLSYDKEYVFDEVLEWEGVIGYGDHIRQLVNDIYNVDLEDQDVE